MVLVVSKQLRASRRPGPWFILILFLFFVTQSISSRVSKGFSRSKQATRSIREEQALALPSPLAECPAAIVTAVEGNKPSVVKELLSKDASLRSCPVTFTLPQKIWKELKVRGIMLHLAANRGFADVLACLLAGGVDPNAPTIEGEYFWKPGSSALMFAAAAENGTKAVKELLLAPGINVNMQAKNGMTALMWAAWTGHRKVAALLLAMKGVLVNLQINDQDAVHPGFSALMFAVKSGFGEVVQALLAVDGIDVNLQVPPDASQGPGRSALMLAGETGQSEVLKYLLGARGILVNLQDRYNRSALSFAAAAGKEVVVGLLLTAPGILINQPDQDGRTPLCQAASRCHVKVAHVLLQAGSIDPNIEDKDGMTALMYASEKNCWEVTQQMLKHKSVNPDLQNREKKTALMLAVESGSAGGIWELVSKGADANLKRQDGMTALMLAVSSGKEEALNALLYSKTIDANSQDKEGLTALMHAVKHDNRKAVQRLREDSRVMVNKRNKAGVNALVLAAGISHDAAKAFLDCGSDHDEAALEAAILEAFMLAAECGYLEAVDVLQEFESIGPESVNEDGDNVLMRAVWGGQLETAESLLKTSKFQLDHLNKAGWTLLHYAVSSLRSEDELVKLVLHRSSQLLDLLTKDKRTALQMAVEKGNDDVVQTLLVHGAAVRHDYQGNNSALRMALERKNLAIVRMLLDKKASVKDDISPTDTQGKRLAIWFGIKHSISSLVEYFADTDSINTLWKLPKPFLSEDGTEDEVSQVGDLFALANSTWMVHMLLDWELSETNHTNSTEVQAVLAKAIEKDNAVAISALCSRGVCERFEAEKFFTEPVRKDKHKLFDKMKDWNRFHWSADSCDLMGMSSAFEDVDPNAIVFFLQEQNQEGATPMEIAEEKCKKHGELGALRQYEASASASPIWKALKELLKFLKNQAKDQESRFYLSILAAFVCTSTLTIHTCFLRLRTLLKSGWCFASTLPLSLVLVGCLVARWEDIALRDPDMTTGSERDQPWPVGCLWCTGIFTGVAGLVLLLTLSAAFACKSFALLLLAFKQKGDDRWERCWIKADLALAVLLLVAVVAKEIRSHASSGGVEPLLDSGGVELLLGSFNVMSYALPFLSAARRGSVLLLRSIAGALALLFSFFFAGMPYRYGRGVYPFFMYLAASLLALAWIDLPGVVWSMVVRAAKIVGIDLDQRFTSKGGKFSSNQLILGRSDMAARGLESALGLTMEAIAAGLQDPIAAMEREVAEYGLEEDGVNNDLENFKYIAYGKSCCPSDYPSAVALSLETGKYHGGNLGPNDFDTGHDGRTLEDWMQLPQVKSADLTKAEFIAVRFYTSSSYGRINDPLRKEVKPHPWALVVYLLDRGIKKLRAVQAKDDPRAFAGQTILWRGMRDREVDVEQFAAIGGTEMAPMSTTTSEEVARHYAESRDPLLFKYIVGGMKTGVSIQFLSLYPKEEEFLYAPLTFLSLRNRYEDDGVKVLVVEPVMS